MIRITEKSYYIYCENKEEHLYCSTFLPQNNQALSGVVMVMPIGYERLRCYMEMFNFARELACAGYPVIIFDYRGEGESCGEFKDYDIETRLQDIKLAVTELRSTTNVKNICFFGVRLGAVLTMLIAQELKVEKVILCDPVCNMHKYANVLLKSNIILQHYYLGEISKKVENLREDMKKGKAVSVYGFYMAEKFLNQLEQIRITQYLNEYSGKSAVMYMSTIEKSRESEIVQWQTLLGTKGISEIIRVNNNFSWFTKRIWTTRLEKLANTVIEWLDK